MLLASNLHTKLAQTLCLVMLFLPTTIFSGVLSVRNALNPLVDEPFPLPAATAEKDYSYQFQSSGGIAPLTWHIIKGALPTGLTLDEKGKLSGKTSQTQATPFAFDVEVTDSSQPPEHFSLSCLLRVKAAPLRIITETGKLKIETVPASTTAPALPNETASTTAPNPPPKNAATTETPATTRSQICGRLHPSSLDQTLSLIKSVPSLIRDDKIKKWVELIETKGRFNQGETPCTQDEKYVKGSQRKTWSDLLSYLALRLSPSDTKTVGSQDKDFQIQRIDLAKIRSEQFHSLSLDTINKQILLLNQYIGNVAVRVRVSNQTIAKAIAFTDIDGYYLINFNADSSQSEYTLDTEADGYHTSRDFTVNPDAVVRVNLPIEDRPVSLLTRAVVGYQQAGAASTAFEQNYFFDLFNSYSVPFHQQINPDFGEKWRAWQAVRVASAPQSGNVTISGLAQNFVTNVGGLNANDAVRVFDFLGGVEYRISGNTALLPSFDRNTKQKFSLSLIADFGFITPADPSTTTKVFALSDLLKAQLEKKTPGITTGKNFVSFTQVDRDRFFRQYYAGLRFQTFFFNRHNIPLQRFPAQLDVTYGQNEYVTSGRLRGGVFRIDGYFPLPYENLQFINLFGSAVLRPTRTKITEALILAPAPNQAASDNNVINLPVSQFNRDYYRIGVGIDFISFVKKLTASWGVSKSGN